MQPGRKKKPIKLALLQGNPGHRPIANDTPDPPAKIPSIPKHLDKIARKEWKNITQELDASGLLSNIDKAVLAEYCVAWSRWVQAEEQIKKTGYLMKTTNGNIITNPILWVANKAMEQVYKYATEFGMSPSARSRIHLEPKDSKDEFEDFLNKKKIVGKP